MTIATKKQLLSKNLNIEEVDVLYAIKAELTEALERLKHHDLGSIEDKIKDIDSQISQYIDQSSPSETIKETANLSDLINSMVQCLNIENCDVHIPDDIPEAIIDHKYFSTAVENVLSSLKKCQTSISRINIICEHDTNLMLKIQLSNGSKEKIFKHFVVKQELNYPKPVIQLHGGNLEEETNLGQVDIVITLPQYRIKQ